MFKDSRLEIFSLHDFEIDFNPIIQNIQPSCFDIDLVNSSKNENVIKVKKANNAFQIINVSSEKSMNI